MSEEMPFEFTVCWGGAVWDRDVLFSLSGDRGVQGWQERPGAPNQVKVVGTETQTLSLHPKSSVISLKHFVTANSSQHTATDFVESKKRDLSSKVLTFMKD